MEAAAIIAIALLDWADFALILALLLLNATISFVEESSAVGPAIPPRWACMHACMHAACHSPLGCGIGWQPPPFCACTPDTLSHVAAAVPAHADPGLETLLHSVWSHSTCELQVC